MKQPMKEQQKGVFRKNLSLDVEKIGSGSLDLNIDFVFWSCKTLGK